MRIFAAMMLGWMGTALAQETPTPGEMDKPVQQARVRELRAQAKEIVKEAEARHKEAQTACWKKILVTACHEDAKKELNARKIEARRLETEANDIDREIRRRDVADKERHRIEAAPDREKAAAKRAEKNRKEQEAAMRRVEQRQAEAEGRQPPAQEGSMRQ